MEMIKQNVMTTNLTKEQTELRFELFDWLKTKELSVQQSVELLSLTADQIRKSALNEKL
ncbi:hypothetical protein [Blautia wexlerae]|jgi:hypothetical protein|uniref:hypothetical protein n=1 Tax=Blautia wexlerae TaxID=418240 RepID=UPI001897856F|nr:hypothetical protein [Blautia wexlerae]MDC0697739.1 hypothetical protein [Blautia wexlerae]DAR27111.1 MAG TPA: hypothetical protein [Caudoviricetes sp.]